MTYQRYIHKLTLFLFFPSKKRGLRGVFLRAALLFLLSLGFTRTAQAADYTFTTIDFPGSLDSEAHGINDSGQIVGGYQDNTGVHGFLRNPDGGYITIDFPGSLLWWSEAVDINDSGQIVGRYWDGNRRVHGFLRNPDGGYITIDFPGSLVIDSEARGINDAGQIVGWYWDSTGVYGFLRNPDGGYITIDSPGFLRWGEALGINNTGQIVGVYWDNTGAGGHGFLRNPDGGYITIEPPGSLASEAFGINDSGQIVGRYRDNTRLHSFLRNPDGGYITIDFPFFRGEVRGINDSGQIVGWYRDNTRMHGFLATPGSNNEICDNGVDDDGDGLVDCEDSDCPPCPSPSEVCDNGVDDDGDGLVDCDDPDCDCQPPIASFTYSPEKPVVGEEITFDASSSSDPDGTIVSYNWDFGDGNTAEGLIVTHTYSKTGKYTVTLTVTDDDGLTSSTRKNINIGGSFMLTFDDGPGPVSTHDILDQLKNIKKANGNPVKAGFFLIGEDKSWATCWDIWQCNIPLCLPFLHPLDLCPDPGVKSNPGVVQRIKAEGHFIGIHTQNHADLQELSPEEVEAQILDCYNTIKDTGVTPMSRFRSPYLHDPKVPLGSPLLSQGWKKIGGFLTGDALPFISEGTIINRCKKRLEEAAKKKETKPVVLIFHDFRGLPGHRFNFVNIVNELVKAGYVLVDFAPAWVSDDLEICDDCPTGKGFISGAVIKAGTGEPLAGKVVTLIRTAPKKPLVRKKSVTDSYGNYRFTNLSDGMYKISVSSCKGRGSKTQSIGGGEFANDVVFVCK